MFRYNFTRHKKHTINFRFLQYIFKFSVCNYKKIIKFYNCFPNICYIVFNRFCTIHRIEYQIDLQKYATRYNNLISNYNISRRGFLVFTSISAPIFVLLSLFYFIKSRRNHAYRTKLALPVFHRLSPDKIRYNCLRSIFVKTVLLHIRFPYTDNFPEMCKHSLMRFKNR